MTSSQTELCRITVFGPAGRADLAVPVSVPVASLLPVLLKHTTDSSEHVVAGVEVTGEQSWVLQRVDGAPFDPEGTPESLEWLEGESFYLRPTAHALPELAFDDMADGMATAVGRQKDRWRPEFGRWLFLTLGVATVALMALLALGAGTTVSAAATCGTLGLLLAGASVPVSRKVGDQPLALVFAVPGALLVGLAAAVAAQGVTAAFDLHPGAVAVGGLGLAAVSAGLWGISVLWAPELPVVPIGVLFGAGFTAFLTTWAHLAVPLEPASAAGVFATIALAALIGVPKLVIRTARLRGPQLPRTAGELQTDIEPLDAEEIAERTKNADRYLTILTVTAALVFVFGCRVLFDAPGWAPTTLALLITTSALVRAGGFLNAWQRIALVLAGVAGCVRLALIHGSTLTFGWRVVVLTVLVAVLVAMVLAVLRPPTRRLVPIWVQRAHWVEWLMAAATLPVLLQVLGVYAWARGLAG
ncbi:type VII secretion integral membrane protein EccD [Lentzea sp. BCCO 10_0061]|uniref:Type VII secretion integral membrane protein EccD n=1 Tax=Lentzea sokolovensis TaxID=3095429 RepID=A0ABU4VCE3_9PSEU|nr:type VII secretion integral membrane protein EccD [Lentzea sp. BCCO 10_0061]MDX8149473.1 type VII secretion integral membrane protein EccD [Lentzea sp. BCCO 10_0061]